MEFPVLTGLGPVQVRFFCSLSTELPSTIKHANDAQHAFSSSSTPTLQNALPALEKMHTAWEKVSNKPRYECFTAALDAGMMKLDEYYQ